jgi:hypothetical protein
MTFTKLKHGRAAVSTEGFTIRRLGNPLSQFYIEYTEGDRQLRYYLENLVPGSVDKIRPQDIGPWLPPHDGESLSAPEQLRIAERIVAGMLFLGDRLDLG